MLNLIIQPLKCTYCKNPANCRVQSWISVDEFQYKLKYALAEAVFQRCSVKNGIHKGNAQSSENITFGLWFPCMLFENIDPVSAGVN